MGGLRLGAEAQQKFDDAKANPDKEGWLEKKGAKRKNWNKRWFYLKDNYLFYCKNQKVGPQGIINLHGCTISKTTGPTVAKNHSFSLLAPKSVSIDAKWTGRTYFMAATSESDMSDWIKCLEENGRKAAERASVQKTASPKMEVTKLGDDSDSDASDEAPVEKKKTSKKSENGSKTKESEEKSKSKKSGEKKKKSSSSAAASGEKKKKKSSEKKEKKKKEEKEEKVEEKKEEKEEEKEESSKEESKEESSKEESKEESNESDSEDSDASSD